MNLFREFQANENLATIFITHDPSGVRAVADTLTVMRTGQMVEQGQTALGLDAPKDPYTQKLWADPPSAGNQSRAVE